VTFTVARRLSLVVAGADLIGDLEGLPGSRQCQPIEALLAQDPPRDLREHAPWPALRRSRRGSRSILDVQATPSIDREVAKAPVRLLVVMFSLVGSRNSAVCVEQ
jgi:hypothetical protein